MALCLDKNKKYLLACSFGPDSMALFSMLLKEGYTNLAVAHVNYHKRDVSNYEESSLKEYCQEHNIKCYVLDTNTLEDHKGNFQAWARDARYKFFKDIYNKERCDALLVAHHEDDLLETYIMQTSRQMIIPFYGINEQTNIYDMNVIRPLLDKRKAYLQQYCDECHVPYSIDCSNNTDDYSRNKIRHHVISHYNLEKRKALRKEIDDLNLLRLSQMKVVNELLKHEDQIFIPSLVKQDFEIQVLALYQLVSSKTHHYDFSIKRVKEIIKACSSSKPNIKVKLYDSFYFVKEYDVLRIVDEIYDNNNSYSYILKEPSDLITPFFEAYFKNGASNRNIEEKDYPLIIRSYQDCDQIIIKGVKRDVRRLFIDWKMPLSLRKRWPLIVNKDGIIIYVPRYQKEFVKDENTNFFVKY